MGTPPKPPRDSPRKLDGVTPKLNSLPPIVKTTIEDNKAYDSAEEEIITAGARCTLNKSRPRLTSPSSNVTCQIHQLREEVRSEEESADLGLESEQSKAPRVKLQDSKPIQIGVQSVEELPDWFPENINEIYRVDRHGGALSYKAKRFLFHFENRI
jgi:hypothetical protein